MDNLGEESEARRIFILSILETKQESKINILMPENEAGESLLIAANELMRNSSVEEVRGSYQVSRSELDQFSSIDEYIEAYAMDVIALTTAVTKLGNNAGAEFSQFNTLSKSFCGEPVVRIQMQGGGFPTMVVAGAFEKLFGCKGNENSLMQETLVHAVVKLSDYNFKSNKPESMIEKTRGFTYQNSEDNARKEKDRLFSLADAGKLYSNNKIQIGIK